MSERRILVIEREGKGYRTKVSHNGQPVTDLSERDIIKLNGVEKLYTSLMESYPAIESMEVRVKL